MQHPTLAKIGQRIAAARKARGLTQPELGDRIDCQQVTISRWETGAAEPGALWIVKLCNALEVSPDYLLGFSDNAAAQALRSSHTYFVDMEAVAAVRRAKHRDDVRPMLEFHARLGADVPANWIEVSADEYAKIEKEAQAVFVRLGVDVKDWVKARRRK